MRCLFLVTLAFAAGCGSSGAGTSPEDAGEEAGQDATTADAGLATRDAGKDAGHKGDAAAADGGQGHDGGKSQDAGVDATAQGSDDAGAAEDADDAADSAYTLPTEDAASGADGGPCPIPAAPLDASTPTTVVGNGTPASCTAAALASAVAAGGIVTFACGAAPATITLASEIVVRSDTTIDGAMAIALSGGKKTRILHVEGPDGGATPVLTVQNLTFANGYTTDDLDTNATDEGGAAIYAQSGTVNVFNCTFTGNQCASTGQNVAGGAISVQGTGAVNVANSTFSGNSGSNGGAIGTLGNDVTIVFSTFVDNSATGNNGNPGNGGNGGALYYDGRHDALTLCADVFSKNSAAYSGGALYRVAYASEPTTLTLSTFDANSAYANGGAMYLQDTIVNVSASTISRNAVTSERSGGGIAMNETSAQTTLNLTNVTVADNEVNVTAGGGLGGGVAFVANTGVIVGTFLNATIAGNTGDGIFGGAGIVLANSIVASNVTGAYDQPNCLFECQNAGANLEYPAPAEDGGLPCAPGETYGDPLLGALGNHGGPTQTMVPASNSPAIGLGTSCPATDQRGNPRAPTGCTLGAVEVP